MLKVFEAFSGYGSQILALKKFGVSFESVGILEIDKYAIQAYTNLHGETKNFGDITKVDVKNLPEMDVFFYSFPCTTISFTGLRTGMDRNSGNSSSLLWECEKIIDEKKPKYLILENVKALVSKRFKKDYDEWLSILEKQGYNSYWKVINAKDTGIPQNRERVFCVSILKTEDDGTFRFDDEFDSGLRVEDIVETNPDERLYYTVDRTKTLLEEMAEKPKFLDEIESKNELIQVGTLDIKGHDILKRVYSKKGIMTTVTTMAGGNTQPKIIETCAVRGRNVIDAESRTSGAKTKQMLEVSKKKGISNCVTTVQKDSLILSGPPFRVRKLSPKECFRLMGVEESDITILLNSNISNSQLYKMAGNSIVVNSMSFVRNFK